MGSPAKDIGDILVAAGVVPAGSSYLLKISRFSRINNPKIVCVYDTGGSAPALIDEDLRVHTLQVRVRGAEYEDAYDRMRLVIEALTSPTSHTINVHRYPSIVLNGDINSLGYDEREYPNFTTNYTAFRHPL